MNHPQPAFDFLMSLPLGSVDIDESVFCDWWAYESINAETDDNIRNYPDIWEKRLELPKGLKELSESDFVSVQPFEGEINLNALAIGLGLEDVKYEPEEFAGLQYCPEYYDGTAFVFLRGVLFVISGSEKSSISTLEQTLNRIESLGLAKDASFDPDVQTNQVSDYI